MLGKKMGENLETLSKQLKNAAFYLFRESLIEKLMENPVSSMINLSNGVRYSYFNCMIENPHLNDAKLSELTVKKVQDKLKFMEKHLPRIIIDAYEPKEAEILLDKLTFLDKDKGLFWKAYFNAEYWNNKDAIKLFESLLNNPTAVNLHWYGNLHGKLRDFSKARAPLEKAASLEPEKYNHHSHLGNVYRGLKLDRKAVKEYLKAIDLINKKPLGRVEYIHLVRCYQGLAELGFSEYSALEKDITKRAIQSKTVSSEELERIKF